MAVECYTECVQKDLANVEAFSKLVDCQLLSGSQKKKLLDGLSFQPEEAWLKKIYISKIRSVEEVGAGEEEEVRK